VGLIAAALEDKGIRTVCLSTFEPIMAQVRPPRWLDLPYPLGFPLGRPLEPALHARILQRALVLLEEPGPAPVRREYHPDGDG
jgi:hypothetical protein